MNYIKLIQANEKSESPFLDMAKAISCLRLELPESVWKDVADRWMAVVKVINAPSPVPDKVEDAGVLKVISDRINYFSKKNHKYEANELHNALNVILRLIPPESWQ